MANEESLMKIIESLKKSLKVRDERLQKVKDELRTEQVELMSKIAESEDTLENVKADYEKRISGLQKTLKSALDALAQSRLISKKAQDKWMELHQKQNEEIEELKEECTRLVAKRRRTYVSSNSSSR
jgi:uncharacterized membrane-anchored protein YhcB (DUF1043 family)